MRIFGTDGIRGRIGDDKINPEFMLKLGWAVGNSLTHHENPWVIIGKDTRISGYMLESALVAGFVAVGVNVYLVGPLPTPAVAYITQSVRAQVGIVISASHNPYDDNGVKFFDQNGLKFSDELELAIEEKVTEPMTTVPSNRLGRVQRLVDAPGRYIEYCKSIFPAGINLSELKIVIDCANGAGYDVAPKIFHELGAKVVPFANTPDGFNINANCGATHLGPLQQQVITHQADIGLALDGDGDRIIMVDHVGEIVDGDEILCILGLDQRYKGIVGTAMSNYGLEEALSKNSIEFVRVPVGDRYVREELQRQGWTLGGETSGHIVDLAYTTTGDGIITALQVLSIMQMRQKRLHDLKKVMQKWPQVVVNVPIKQKICIEDYPEWLHYQDEIKEIYLGAGRIVVRPSGTEACVRIMVEGKDLNAVEQAAKALEQRITQSVRVL